MKIRSIIKILKVRINFFKSKTKISETTYMYQKMSKKRQKLIDKKINEFTNMHKPKERSIELAEELLDELFPMIEFHPNYQSVNSKTSNISKANNEIKYLLVKVRKNCNH